jgi:hypothetical protein
MKEQVAQYASVCAKCVHSNVLDKAWLSTLISDSTEQIRRSRLCKPQSSVSSHFHEANTVCQRRINRTSLSHITSFEIWASSPSVYRLPGDIYTVVALSVVAKEVSELLIETGA